MCVQGSCWLCFNLSCVTFAWQLSVYTCVEANKPLTIYRSGPSLTILARSPKQNGGQNLVEEYTKIYIYLNTLIVSSSLLNTTFLMEVYVKKNNVALLGVSVLLPSCCLPLAASFKDLF